MRAWKVDLAAESKERVVAKEQIGLNLASESVAMTFSLDGGGEELRRTPMAYIPDLPAKVKQLLDQNDRYYSMHSILKITSFWGGRQTGSIDSKRGHHPPWRDLA